MLQYLCGLVVATAVVLIFQPARPALAGDPTPTPSPTGETTGQAGGLPDAPCRLEPGTNCEFPTRDDLIMSGGPVPRTYPSAGARGVSLHSLISVSFDRDMDLNTINNRTFQVQQAETRLEGSVRYIGASRTAVFYPDQPLLPGTEYIARFTTGGLDIQGEALAGDLEWRFTTVSPAGEQVEPEAGMQVYFGDLHSHTGYSDGWYTPAEAFATARANGLDFFAVTDHDIMLTETEWQDILAQANTATVNGKFVALRGFEFTHPKGHLNVFDTDTFVRGDDPAYANLANFYGWLAGQPRALAQFNHPKLEPNFDWNFNNFAYYPAADLKIVLRELSNAEQFFLSLNRGWHVGALANSDTHQPNWGCCPLMGVLAPALTKADILDGLRARRTFFVSPDDRNLALVMQANGYWMGSAIPNTGQISFVITAYDPNPKGQPLKMALYDNGARLTSVTLPSSTAYRWQPSIAARLGHYYYVEAYRNGWSYPAYSSPVWVERPPVANAGSSQFAAPGAVVKLDGRASQDPDGDALAYRWTQQSGATVSLIQANQPQPSFTAPGTPGDIIFKLKVTDPGGMSDSDTTGVTVTNKPILAISKWAPATTGPGEPIVYTLTVTNSGVTAAAGVVITDELPTGATHVGGGTLSGNTVSWSGLNLAANGGSTQVSFTVTAAGGLVNARYGATCSGCISVQGTELIFTNANKLYLPVMRK